MVVSKTKHSKTKTEARSTQISKTKHPNFENEVPKTRKRSTQDSKTKHPKPENEAPKSRNHCALKDNNFKSCMTQAKPGGGNGCIRTSNGQPIQIRKSLCLPIFGNIREIRKWPIVRATEMHLQHLVVLLELHSICYRA